MDDGVGGVTVLPYLIKHKTQPQPQPGVAYPKEITAPLPDVDPLVPPEGSEDD